MPTYEYRCPEGHDFEKFVQKMSDARSELPCPTCGLVAARRMSAGGGLLFKGSGFYITDYGKDGKKDQRAASAKPDASTTPPGAAAAGGPSATGGAAKADNAPASGGTAKAASAASTSTGTSAAPKSGPAK
jgi:putative FmdB family regulatory protein